MQDRWDLHGVPCRCWQLTDDDEPLRVMQHDQNKACLRKSA